MFAGNGNLSVHLGKMCGDMDSCSCLCSASVDKLDWQRKCLDTCPGRLEQCKGLQEVCLVAELRLKRLLVGETLKCRWVSVQSLQKSANFQLLEKLKKLKFSQESFQSHLRFLNGAA